MKICAQSRKQLEDATKAGRRNSYRAMRGLENYDFHRSVMAHQLQQYQKYRETLKDGEALITNDFGAINLYSNFNDTSAIQMITSHNFVIEWRENGLLKRQYVAIMCDDPSSNNNDIFFPIASWDALLSPTNPTILSNRRFRKLIIWSDGGPKHFKNRYAIAHFARLAATTKIEYLLNFFASYHGHSLCDALDGQICDVIQNIRLDNEGYAEQKKKYEARLSSSSSSSSPKSLSDDLFLQCPVPETAPSNASELATLLEKKLKNVTVIVLGSINRDPNLRPWVKAFPTGLKRWHQILFVSEFSFIAREKSNDSSANEKQITITPMSEEETNENIREAKSEERRKGEKKLARAKKKAKNLSKNQGKMKKRQRIDEEEYDSDDDEMSDVESDDEDTNEEGQGAQPIIPQQHPYYPNYNMYYLMLQQQFYSGLFAYPQGSQIPRNTS
jgi:hypothetical protein